METTRVDICYRPLRIGWAICAGDSDAFRQAVQMSYALWGGRFNPIVIVDYEDEADRLIDLFRVDLVFPIGDSETVKKFPKRFPYLINPFFSEPLFVGRADERKHAQVLDIHNALVHFRDTPQWKTIKDKGVRIYEWQADDALADVFLVQFGGYPSTKEVGIDYVGMVVEAAEATESAIEPDAAIPSDTLDHPTIAYLSRLGLERHYSVQAGWDWPGFFVGDATNLDDLVCHWNLRASDIPLWFVDPDRITRYTDVIPAWEKLMRETIAHRHEWKRHVAIWSRRENIKEVRGLFGDGQLTFCSLSIHSWNGHNLRPPMMHFDQVSTLGVSGHESGKPKVSFALNDKPFCGDVWFHTQHLIASISFIGGLYGDEHYTLHPPFIPDLNEFYARTMHFRPDRLRIESERVGLVIDAADSDAFLYVLPVADLIERVFDLAGFSAKLSRSGLIIRQLIAQLGGLYGADVFRIPGVRRLLKTHGPMTAFTKRGALQLIGAKDPENPDAKFEDPFGRKLEANSVFSGLVEKGLYRIGRELTCPNCRMASWISLDAVKQQVICELCGHEYDATRQLVNGEWHYRRSGVLGTERNAQGAIPVALTLQQLRANRHGLHQDIYSPSLDLTPKEGTGLPKCEIDFVWMIARPYPQKTVIILGECKDQGFVKLQEFEKDIDHLRRVADAFPPKCFETFVLIAKLSPFSSGEIECAKTLNDKYRSRAILLTARELEPHFMYQRTKAEFKIEEYASTPEDMAAATVTIYFKEQPSVTG